MVIKIYLMVGLIFEILIMWNYLKDDVPFTKSEILAGFIIDVFIWPIILLINIISWLGKGRKR